MLSTGPEIDVAVFFCYSGSRLVPVFSNKSRLTLDCSLLVLFGILWLMNHLGFIYVYPIWKWVLFCLVAVWASLSSPQLPKGHDSETNEILPQLYLFPSHCWLVQQQTIYLWKRHSGIYSPPSLCWRSQPVPAKGHSPKTLCAHAHVILHSLASSKQHWGKKNYKACCSLE